MKVRHNPPKFALLYPSRKSQQVRKENVTIELTMEEAQVLRRGKADSILGVGLWNEDDSEAAYVLMDLMDELQKAEWPVPVYVPIRAICRTRGEPKRCLMTCSESPASCRKGNS